MALSLQRYTYSDFSSGLNSILKERSEKERQKSMVIAMKIGNQLPENLIIEILSWLPVKTLLQFKTVCKSWYAIISSPNFISKHLKNYYNVSDHDCLLAQYYVSHAELQLFELLVDETSRSVLSYEVLYHMPMYGSYVCGPCDGLYYLYNYDYADRALWNPAINELKVLPPLIMKPNLPSSNMTYATQEVYGFGIDPVAKDYKVVVIKGYWSTSEEEVKHPLSVLIYSLRTDSWRYWGDLEQDYDLENNKCYISVNGVFYWLGSCPQYENTEVVISFDMANNAVEEIQVPDYSKPASKSLAIYHDSIAFLTVHETEKCFDIWTLNEGFWTKSFTMGPLPQVQHPIGHWKNNKFLLECEDSKLVLCDTDTQETRELAFERGTLCEGISAYMDSLVSVNDRNALGQQEDTETDGHEV